MITILIPTLNRSDFVVRYLAYLRDTGFRGRVFIGDSSIGAHLERTRSFARGIHEYQVVIYEYPGLKHFECIRAMLQHVETPYVTYVGDDDLLVPGALEDCMRFLDTHPEYSAATGVGITLHFSADTGGTSDVQAVSCPLNALEAESASERLLDLLTDYTVVAYSVSRTEDFRARWEDRPTFSDKALAVELLPCSMLAIQGKLRKLDRLFVVRCDHQQRYLLPDHFDWITTAGWSTSFHIFSDWLSVALARQDGIDSAEAKAVVKRAFWAYLMRSMSTQWSNRYGSPIPEGSLVRRLLRRIPGVRRAWQLIRYSGRPEPVSLSQLLEASSTYHSDFLPAYRALTAPVNWPGEPTVLSRVDAPHNVETAAATGE